MTANSAGNQRLGWSATFLGALVIILSLLGIVANYILLEELPPAWQLAVPEPYGGPARALPFVGLVIGAYCFVWGSAVLARRAWGLYHAATTFGAAAILTVAAGYLWYRHAPALDLTAQEGPWLITAIGIAIAAVLAVSFALLARWLMFSDGIRELYAGGYQYRRYPATYRTCREDGMILERDNTCLLCDQSAVELVLTLPEYMGPPQSVTLRRDWPKAVVGRSAECDVPLTPDLHSSLEAISKRHFEVRYDFDQRCLLVTDLDSRNGTFVEGERLIAGKGRELDADYALIEVAGIPISLSAQPVSRTPARSG